MPTFPEGKALPWVLGLLLSKRASTIRLNAMALLLALTMATRIHNNFSVAGKPSAAKNALMIANGRANTVCWIFISDKMIANRLHGPASTKYTFLLRAGNTQGGVASAGNMNKRRSLVVQNTQSIYECVFKRDQ